MAMINRTRGLFFSIVAVLSIFILLLGIQGSYAKTPALKSTQLNIGLADDGEPPILRAVPEQSNWIADGTTQYKITIIGDSRPMNPNGTRGIQFGYFLPEVEGYTFNLVSVTMRPQNDFFAGWSTINLHGGSMIGRVLSGSGTGPINREGDVVYMWFTVSKNGNGLENAQTSLGINPDPDFTFFAITGTRIVSPVIESIQFYVMSEEYALGSSCRNSSSQAAAC